VQRHITADIDAPPASLFDVVADLGSYPHWLDLVARVEPAPADARDEGTAWFVTLRAKVGPFARSKRLRMVRTVADSPTHVRYERREHDNREHSSWVMDAQVGAVGAGSRVDIVLSYGGRLWSGPLEAVLGGSIDDGVPRLQQYVRAHA
jgi:Polyketide cyclase / dehydrase and lipid transport